MRNLKGLLLGEILPASIAEDRQVQAGAAALNPELQSVSLATREAYILSRIDELPEAVLDLLAWQFHVDFYEPLSLSVEAKRRLVKNSIRWHRKKGTIWAVRQILADLGVTDIRIREWWDLQSDPYTFAIEGYFEGDSGEITTFLGPDTNKLLWRAVEVTKPVRSWLRYLVVVPPPPEIDPDHICRWDVCHWSHGRTKEFSLSIDGFHGGLDPTVRYDGDLGFFDAAAYERSLKWDVGRWDSLLLCGQKNLEKSFFAETIYRCGDGDLGFLKCYFRNIPKSLAVWGWDIWDGDARMAPRKRVVPDMGTFGESAWSGERIPGAHYEPILEYSARREYERVERLGTVLCFDGVLPGFVSHIQIFAPFLNHGSTTFFASATKRYDGTRPWMGGWNDVPWDCMDETYCYAAGHFTTEGS